MTGEFLRHEPCSKCGSSDALAVYDDGWSWCFSCQSSQKNEEEAEAIQDQKILREFSMPIETFLSPTPTDLPKRKISRAVCASHDYGVADWKGIKVQVAGYRSSDGQLVAQKIKTPDKQFVILGDGKNLPLWQQHRWKSGRRLLITEGETDLLAWQSIPGNDRWPAVSLPNGAGGAVKAIKRNLEFVEGFEEVVLFFDSDEPGIKAAKDVAEFLTPGKARIAKVPGGCKDICEAIQNGLEDQVKGAFWNAGQSRPDGIVGSNEILQAVLAQKDVQSVPYPWEGLNRKLRGLRMGELITLTAGTGIGKSQVCRALATHLIRKGHKVGYISLEESLARTGLGLLEQVMARPLHLDRNDLSDEALIQVWKEHFEDQICVFNHFGSLDAENLLSKIRYMRIAEGADFIFVDHLSILVSGWGEGDERRLIDNVMTALRSTVEQTGCGMILVSHLRKLDTRSRSHEEGGRPSLSDLRGSAAIAQLSDGVVGLCRNQQADDPNITEVLVLKNRFSGATGRACYLRYDPDTGLMSECQGPDEEEASDYGFDDSI